MADWQKGDLALCVKKGRRSPTIPGRLYEVTGYRIGTFEIGLFFEGVENGCEYGPPHFWGHAASRFRKVTPPKADQFDREVIDLMAGKKVPA